ncbi:hypothetical protein [Janibacter sp. GS2]|uniref:hypothetical protein n=1 Tax=Janibacter sp. GS2 TaxID=3442646 RepID=UPI003EBB0E4F
MSGEAVFWIFIVVFTVVMFGAFFFLDRPKPSRNIPTKLSVHTDSSDPRGRHRPAERVDPAETDSRL